MHMCDSLLSLTHKGNVMQPSRGPVNRCQAGRPGSIVSWGTRRLSFVALPRSVAYKQAIDLRPVIVLQSSAQIALREIVSCSVQCVTDSICQCSHLQR